MSDFAAAFPLAAFFLAAPAAPFFLGEAGGVACGGAAPPAPAPGVAALPCLVLRVV